MKDNLSLKILIVDDNIYTKSSVEKELCWALLWDLNRNATDWERISYMEKYKKLTFLYAIDLKEVSSILSKGADLDLITVDGNIGENRKESGTQVLRHLKDYYPKLLEKTIALSWDKRYLKFSKQRFKIKSFEKDMGEYERKRFRAHVQEIIAK